MKCWYPSLEIWLLSDFFLIPSIPKATSFIVGLSFPFNPKQLLAKVATINTCPFFPCIMTWGSRISNRWLCFMDWMKYATKLLAWSSDLLKDTAFCPVSSSTRTTPKLYTSLLSVNWLDWKYSASKYPKVPELWHESGQCLKQCVCRLDVSVINGDGSWWMQVGECPCYLCCNP